MAFWKKKKDPIDVAIDKAVKCIETSETQEQLETSKNLVVNLFNLYKMNSIDRIGLTDRILERQKELSNGK